MPDQYGRFSMQDGMKIGADISAMMNANKRNELRDEQLKEIRQGRQDREEVGQGFAALQNGQDVPENLSPQNRVAAQGLYATSLGHGDAIATSQANEAARKYAEEWKRNGGDVNRLHAPSNAAEMAGQSSFFRGLTDNEVARDQLRKAQMGRISQQYSTFRPHAIEALKCIQAGDTAGARPHIEAAGKAAPIPYRYKWDEGSGFYVEEFRDNRTGRWEQNRHVTEEEAAQALTQVMRGEQVSESGHTVNPYFFQTALNFNEATRHGNLEARNDPSHWLTLRDRKGRVFKAVPQNNLWDHDRSTDYILMDSSGKIIRNAGKQAGNRDPHSGTSSEASQNSEMFSMDELNARGLMPENLERAKSLAEIAKTRQQTATSKAQEELVRKGGGKGKPFSLSDQKAIYGAVAQAFGHQADLNGEYPMDNEVAHATGLVMQKVAQGVPLYKAVAELKKALDHK
ncbi:hypothetical protein [Pseudodesulfovibrio tunisiensis]|uniref:hypothetical protein n=1 Tax=Pseudodesulfovibrio tunisiensis TaxID=463192 RepID=UPI001FB442B4|nr:hypothetical protein [Pseudodesulfovibrio tunisiensis]